MKEEKSEKSEERQEVGWMQFGKQGWFMIGKEESGEEEGEGEWIEKKLELAVGQIVLAEGGKAKVKRIQEGGVNVEVEYLEVKEKEEEKEKEDKEEKAQAEPGVEVKTVEVMVET